MTEPTKEQAWKEEARKAYQDQQSQDNEGGCREPIGFVQGYLAAKESDFEKIAELEKLSEMQARDAFSRYKEIKNLLELTETLNQIRDNLQDENRKLEQELQKTREHLEVAEAVLSVQCTDSALAYFKDKQGEG